MASISKQSNGRRTIQFVWSKYKRRSIRLGKVSQRHAEAIKHRVEQLNTARVTGHAIEPDTARWLAEIDDVLADKLSQAGLIPKRERAVLKEFLDSYIATRTDVKKSGHILYDQTRRNLVNFFGRDKSLREITPGDGDEWRLWLGDHEKLSESTINRRCRTAKQFMRAATRKKLIPENPFVDLKSGVSANPSRLYYVKRDVINKVLDACPDAEWRLIVALSRFGGLRCPSEHLNLRWGDVDWERGRIRITSPKTARHPGGEPRIIPLFPELRSYLDEVYDQADPGTEYVISRYRDSNANLRTQLLRIINRAGLKSWPKLFQNLRSTRETELAEEYPLHVVCAWIGNSQPVAIKHYLQVTDDHYEQAVTGTKSGNKTAVQNPVQSAHATGRNDSQANQERPIFAEQCDQMRPSTNGGVRLRGFEPPTYGLGNRCSIP